MDDHLDEEILRMVMKESEREFERECRKQLIARQDEEYRRSLETDKVKMQTIIIDDEPPVVQEVVQETKDPKEGDSRALREARLRYFKK